MKLRKLRALRGQGNNVQQQPRPTSTSVSTDLEAIRSLFTEKEKELGLAVRKVDELTHQLDDLRNGRVSNHFPPQMVELERLRRELAYRKQLNEQQNNMISQQVKKNMTHAFKKYATFWRSDGSNIIISIVNFT